MRIGSIHSEIGIHFKKEKTKFHKLRFLFQFQKKKKKNTEIYHSFKNFHKSFFDVEKYICF